VDVVTIALVEPSHALQTAIRGRLVATPAVTSLVPAAHIFDRSRRPERFPSIVLGEGQTVRERVTLVRRHFRAFANLHIWTEDESTGSAKAVAWAVIQSIRSARLSLDDWHVIELTVDDARYMRDPKPELSHGVVTVSALVEEPAT
jgi:hypothetical protein